MRRWRCSAPGSGVEIVPAETLDESIAAIGLLWQASPGGEAGRTKASRAAALRARLDAVAERPRNPTGARVRCAVLDPNGPDRSQRGAARSVAASWSSPAARRRRRSGAVSTPRRRSGRGREAQMIVCSARMDLGERHRARASAFWKRWPSDSRGGGRARRRSCPTTSPSGLWRARRRRLAEGAGGDPARRQTGRRTTRTKRTFRPPESRRLAGLLLVSRERHRRSRGRRHRRGLEAAWAVGNVTPGVPGRRRPRRRARHRQHAGTGARPPRRVRGGRARRGGRLSYQAVLRNPLADPRSSSGSPGGAARWARWSPCALARPPVSASRSRPGARGGHSTPRRGR